MKETIFSETPSENSGLRFPQRLWDEYKLVQEKLDKIGEFQFKIKSWSATLLGAVLFGGAAYSRIPAALISALVLAAVFQLVETRQHRLRKALGRRALTIEHAFRHFPLIADSEHWKSAIQRNPSIRSVPSIARSMGGSLAVPIYRNWILKCLMRLVEPLVLRANNVFYWAQYLLLAGLLAGHVVSSRVKILRGPDDSKPRYEISVGSFRIIVYKANN